MARLPTVGSDSGTWGTVLNDFLSVSNNNDGTLKSGIVTSTQLASGAVTSAKISTGAVTSGAIAAKAVGAVAMNSTGAASGAILTANGTDGVSWVSPYQPQYYKLVKNNGQPLTRLLYWALGYGGGVVTGSLNISASGPSFTVQTSGIYSFKAKTSLTNVSVIDVWIYKNASLISGSSSTAPTGTQLAWSNATGVLVDGIVTGSADTYADAISCVAGDTLGVIVRGASSADPAIDSHSFFQIVRLA